MKQSPAVSLLLTNLRLLNYGFDAENSFPITVDVFTSLTNKGKAFEHIIYHLFRTFDPEECELKLQGCWPIFEPSQSRELRNAVFKWLEDLKKSGRLAGVLIRRTTLDDCCGQRYEELLLALSTMVLRDRIEQGAFPDVGPTLAYQQAVSTQPSQRYLNTLTVAHRKALGNLLDARRESEFQWESFKGLLDERHALVASMTEQFTDVKRVQTRTKVQEDCIQNKWQNNWLGDPRWLDIILNGDPELTRDRFLELPFEKALETHRDFMEGGVATDTMLGNVSLKGLERQVAEQRRRVEEIRRLREQTLAGLPMLRPGTGSPSRSTGNNSIEKRKGLKVEFKNHQNLHLKNAAAVTKPKRNRQNQYDQLLNTLRKEMVLASALSQRVQEKPEVPVYYQYEEQETTNQGEHPETPASPEIYRLSICLSDKRSTYPSRNSWIGDRVSTASTPRERDYVAMEINDGAEYGHHRDEYGNQEDQAGSPVKISDRVEESERGHGISTSPSSGSYLNTSEDDESSTHPISFRTKSPEQNDTPCNKLSQKLFKKMRYSVAFGDEELLAEQIVSSIAGAQASPEKPSPIKKRGRASTDHRLNRHSVFDYSPEPLGDAGTMLPPPPSQQQSTKSMFQQKDHTAHSQSSNDASNGKRAYNRTSVLANPIRTEPQLAATTPKEELLASADYNSVFKSRPKIAMSPTMTPSKSPPRGLNISMIGDGDRFDDYDNDDDEVMEYISSPLADKIRR